MVGDEDEIVAVASDGQTIRTPVHGIRHIGRDATGVSIMNLAEGQTVASVALILATDDDD
jgi:DNA gyrase subunit A